MPVALLRFSEDILLLVRNVHPALTKCTSRGAISSWSVHPRLIHLVSEIRRPKWIFPSCAPRLAVTSSNKAMQMVAFWYHRYIELIASCSSELEVLSIQHVSIQKYL